MDDAFLDPKATETQSPVSDNRNRDCLLSAPLSFYDAFHAVNGVPAFLLTPERPPSQLIDENDIRGSADSENGLENEEVVTCCAFSHNGYRLASGHSSGRVCLWDVYHGKLLFCRDDLHDVPICDICFRDKTDDIVMTSDREGRCVEWIARGLEHAVHRMDVSNQWKTGTEDLAFEVVIRRISRFFNRGSIVVFAVTIETCRLGSGAFMLSESDLVVVFSVMDTTIMAEGRCLAQLRFTAKKSDDVVTSMEMSQDGTGLLVGFTDGSVKEGYVVLWPNFREHANFYDTLRSGTLGTWAPDGVHIVTWTVPEVPFPEDNDACCAFLWDVGHFRKQIQESAGESDFEYITPTELRNPFGKNVLWCRFTRDPEEKTRLVMGVVRSTVHLLLWDIDSRILTHDIPTGIPTDDVIFGSRKRWKECWVDDIFVKGLKPLEVTADAKWLGAVAGHKNRAVVWDAAQGVELLNIALPQDLSETIGNGADLVMGSSPGAFAMIGRTSILVFCPPVAREDEKRQQPKQMVEITYHDVHNTPEGSMKTVFSSNGEVLAALHGGSPSLHLWSLHAPVNLTIRESTTSEYQVTYGRFKDFALGVDFAISENEPSFLVTFSTKYHMLIWECTSKAARIEGVIASKETSFCREICLMQDNAAIVVCENSGDLAWYLLQDDQKSSSMSFISLDDEHRPLLNRRSQDDLRERPAVCQSRGFLSTKILPRHRSEYYDTASRNQHSLRRFSLARCVRKKAQGSHSCRFSADCKTAVLMPDCESVFIWDLEERIVMRKLTQQIDGGEFFPESSTSSAHSIAHFTILQQKLASNREILSYIDKSFVDNRLKTQLSMPEKTVVVSEHVDVYLVANVAGSDQNDDQQDPSIDHLFKENKREECSSLYVINTRHPEATRKLSGIKLRPLKGKTPSDASSLFICQTGMAISADGRYVACPAAARGCSKILVWSCYSNDLLLPAFCSLELMECVQSKQRVTHHFKLLLDRFGANLINYVQPHGATLLFDAITNINDEVLDVVLQHAVTHRIKVSLETEDERRKNGVQLTNGVELAIKNRSPEIASKIMEYLMKRVTHEDQMSRILKKSLVSMIQRYPKIFADTLHHPELFSTVADIRIPEALFGTSDFAENLSNYLYAVEEHTTEIWDKRCKEEGLIGGDPVTVAALSKVLPYPDACQVGNRGLLRPMLVNGASDTCFAAFAIKAIVTHKWRQYAENLLRREFCHYGVLLICFTLYCFFLVFQDTYNSISLTGNEENNWKTGITFAVCWIIAVPKLYKEFVQASFYWRDYKLKGLYYWLASAWNWMEILCYISIIVLIPIGQYWLLKEGKRATYLSGLVALESLLLWCKVLYYLQPFRSTGPLVIIVSAIALDILPFLLLATCVMLGFTVAFFVLYRHYRYPEDPLNLHDVQQNPVPHHGQQQEDQLDDPSDVLFSFKDFGHTLFSVMRFLFGDFDSQVLFDAPLKGMAIFLFVLYMIIMTIILLNMMIAIMSDSFSRIKSNEETQFVKARAIAIDDVESMLSIRHEQQLRKDHKTFLHVAVPKYSHDRVMNALRRRDRRETPHTNMQEIVDLLNTLVQREHFGREEGLAEARQSQVSENVDRGTVRSDASNATGVIDPIQTEAASVQRP